jgi:hypothetical protein
MTGFLGRGADPELTPQGNPSCDFPHNSWVTSYYVVLISMLAIDLDQGMVYM